MVCQIAEEGRCPRGISRGAWELVPGVVASGSGTAAFEPLTDVAQEVRCLGFDAPFNRRTLERTKESTEEIDLRAVQVGEVTDARRPARDRGQADRALRIVAGEQLRADRQGLRNARIR